MFVEEIYMLELIRLLLFPILIIWGGVLWRIRGGAWETFLGFAPRTQAARFFTSLALAIPLSIIFMNPWLLLITFTIFLGLISMAWGPYMVIEESLDIKTTLYRMFMMSGCGLIVVSYTYVLLSFLYSWILALPILMAGAIFGPIYWLCYRSWFPKFEVQNLLWKDGHTWSEFYVGVTISVALFITLFFGS
jgi:hypothetical protein